jgi:hypothetical protein
MKRNFWNIFEKNNTTIFFIFNKEPEKTKIINQKDLWGILRPFSLDKLVILV